MRQCTGTSEFVGMFLSEGLGPFCSWSLAGIKVVCPTHLRSCDKGWAVSSQHGATDPLWLPPHFCTRTDSHRWVISLPFLVFFIPCLSHLSTVGLCGKWQLPLWRWQCDGSPVLGGNSMPCVIHAVKDVHTLECGTGPWEVFPTLLVMVTEICFLYRHSTCK